MSTTRNRIVCIIDQQLQGDFISVAERHFISPNKFNLRLFNIFQTLIIDPYCHVPIYDAVKFKDRSTLKVSVN